MTTHAGCNVTLTYNDGAQDQAVQVAFEGISHPPTAANWQTIMGQANAFLQSIGANMVSIASNGNVTWITQP